MHLLAGRFVLWGDDRGFLKKGIDTYLMAPMSPLNSQLFSVFTSLVYGCERAITSVAFISIKRTRLP
jgi:hypothetical protein